MIGGVLKKKLIEIQKEYQFQGKIEPFDYDALELKYNIDQKDLEYIRKLILGGQPEEAIDFYMKNYGTGLSKEYMAQLQYALELSERKVLTKEQMNNIISNMNKTQEATTKNLYDSYQKISDYYTQAKNIASGAYNLASGTAKYLANLNARRFGEHVGFVSYFAMHRVTMTMMRLQWYLQRDMSQAQQIWSTDKPEEKSKIREIINKTRQMIANIKKTDSTYIATKKGGIESDIKSYLPEGSPEVSFGEEDYMPLSDYLRESSDSWLNKVNNELEEILIGDSDVVEYVWFTHRPVTKDRVICKEVLGQELLGKSLVAMSQEVADLLDIPYIDDIKRQGAMCNFCRHTIQQLDKDFIKLLNEYVKEKYKDEPEKQQKIQ